MLVQPIDAPLNCFPPVVDNSILCEFISCPQSCFRKYIQGYVPVLESVHLVAGAAYAKGLEMARRAYYEEGKDEEEAIAIGSSAAIQAYGGFEPPEDSNKTCLRVAGAVVRYFDQYPMATDFIRPMMTSEGKAMVEYSFVLPLPINNPDTGEPLLYSGRFDMLADYDGTPFGEDDKTASRLGASWGKKWELARQFTGYTWGVREYGINLGGFIIRGISFLSKTYGFEQPIVYRPPHLISMWYEQTLRDINRMISCYVEWKKTGKNSEWDYNLDDACSAYGGCCYRPVCQSNDPETWIKEFALRRFDPTNQVD